MPEVKRTLVKSGPELWAEVSDPAALARHLGPFGSVRITHVEPEHLLRWEGDHARGTVRLEPSGFGTRVILAADSLPVEPEPAPPAPEPVAPEPAPEPKIGFWARLLSRRRRPEPIVVPEPAIEPVVVTIPQPEPAVADDTIVAVLTETLDTLGTAHHRPFSRA